MTCIVALKTENKIYMGGDSCSVDGHRYLLLDKEKQQKIIIKKQNEIEYLIGACGSVRPIQVIEYCFNIPSFTNEDKNICLYIAKKFIPEMINCLENNNSLKKHDSIVSYNGEFVVGFAGEIFLIDSRFGFEMSKDNYLCTGSGIDVAYGSLYSTKDKKEPEERINIALDSAAEIISSVRPPNVIKHIDIPSAFQKVKK